MELPPLLPEDAVLPPDPPPPVKLPPIPRIGISVALGAGTV